MHTSSHQLSQADLDYLKSMPSSEFEAWLTNLANQDESLAVNILHAVSSLPICSKKSACQFFGIAPETIELWQRKGMPVESKLKGESRYDLAQCAQWIVRQRSGVLSKDDSDKQVNMEYREEKRRIAELQRRKMEGELYEVQYLDQRLSAIKSVIRKRLDQIQKAFGDDVVSELGAIIDDVIKGMGSDDINVRAD